MRESIKPLRVSCLQITGSFDHDICRDSEQDSRFCRALHLHGEPAARGFGQTDSSLCLSRSETEELVDLSDVPFHHPAGIR